MIEPNTEIIRKCLARCPECTGRYISDVLGKRFVCHCPCHLRRSPSLPLGNEYAHENKILYFPELEGIAYNHQERANDYKHHHRWNAQKKNKTRDHPLPFQVAIELGEHAENSEQEI